MHSIETTHINFILIKKGGKTLIRPLEQPILAYNILPIK